MAKIRKQSSYNFENLECIQDFFIMDFKTQSDGVMTSGNIFYLGQTYRFLTSHCDLDSYIYVVFDKDDTKPSFYFVLYYNDKTGRFDLIERPKKK